MLIVLTGRSCSGKDTVQKLMMRDLDVQKIVTYTTRPIRPGEQDGVNYHFISPEEFEKKRADGFFLESVGYNTMVGGKPETWYYGSSVESYREAEQSSEVYTVILTRPGLQALRDQGIDCYSVYLDASDEEIRNRQFFRRDDPTEAARRFEADKHDFKGIEKEVDMVCYTDMDKSTAQLAYYIYTWAKKAEHEKTEKEPEEMEK